MEKTKICIVCGKKFVKPITSSVKRWEKAKYCSSKCSGIAWMGHPAPKSAFKKGMTPWNKGKSICSNDCLKIYRESGGGVGEKHPNWKGSEAKYGAIHAWVKGIKGKPSKCSNCGKISDWIHWSNIDHRYRRNIADYIALCASCHKRYDLDNGLVKH